VFPDERVDPVGTNKDARPDHWWYYMYYIPGGGRGCGDTDKRIKAKRDNHGGYENVGSTIPKRLSLPLSSLSVYGRD